jgi:hypothetical protein
MTHNFPLFISSARYSKSSARDGRTIGCPKPDTVDWQLFFIYILNNVFQLFTNINKTKESLNSDGQLFTNINKTKESLNSDGQLFTNTNKTKEI